MRKLVLAIAAALSGAAVLSDPALAAPTSNLGALNAAAATLSNVEPAAVVCNRWRCRHTYRYDRPYYYQPYYQSYYYYRPYFWHLY